MHGVLRASPPDSREWRLFVGASRIAAAATVRRAARGAPAGRLPEDGGAGSQVHAATGRVPAPAPRRAQRAGPTFLPSPSLAPSLLKTEDITYMTDPG